MDFRNLCQRFDVDSIKAKIPPMPAMPAIPLPQLKLPKSIPKLKSRKIFRSSRENVNSPVSPGKQTTATARGVTANEQHADFIDHTPQRISTISSLMYQAAEAPNNQSTYRSACSLDEDYPATPPQVGKRGARRPISPVRASQSLQTTMESPNNQGANNSEPAKMSFADKLQKGYKDISEFRLKHIFAKKTVVRKDIIQVDHYVERYDEDRQREQQEQQRRDRQIAENYRFKFKVSRQNTGHTDSVTSNESPVSAPKDAKVSQVSDDESGMDESPPQRKPGIAATRFANVRKPPKSLSEDYNDEGNDESKESFENAEDNDKAPKPDPLPSSLWSTRVNRTPVENSPIIEAGKSKNDIAGNKSKSYKDRLRRLTSYVSSHDESGVETSTETPNASAGTRSKVISHLRSFGKNNEEETSAESRKKRKAPLSPQQSEEDYDKQRTSNKTTNETATGENTFTTLKQNFKRFQKSLKRQQTPPPPPTVDSEDEESERNVSSTKSVSRTDKFTSRLRKFRSRDDIENISSSREGVSNSPVHTITNKLQTWKKSFKKKSTETNETHMGDDSSPEKPKRSGNLIKKLKYIRTRKNANSNNDLDATDDDEGATKQTTSSKSSNLEGKFTQARKQTFKRVNEKMQNIKLFHRSQECVDKGNVKKASSSEDEDNRFYTDSNAAMNMAPTITRRSIQDDYQRHNSDNEDIDDVDIDVKHVQQEYEMQTAHAIWTTKPISCDSLESDTDVECPRVLIHQDNSDIFESTLIIAVTRPAPSASSPIISEIPNSPKTSNKPPRIYTPNSSPKTINVNTTRKAVDDGVIPIPPMRGHTRKPSIESNSDSDSWIPERVRSKPSTNTNVEDLRHISTKNLNRQDEHEEPWKVHTMFSQRLYKTKSIDIFEKSLQKGGVLTAFEDFDDELRDEPVVKISQLLKTGEANNNEDAKLPDDDKIPVEEITKLSADVIGADESKPKDESHLTQQLADSQKRQFGNSRESLIASLDETETEDESDRPPSTAPSPPPTIAPPPPPLPLRKSAARTEKPLINDTASPPPLPTTKPPPLPNKPPPQVPERTASMTRIAKPLVKTSSLRLAYNEQVKPADVGKVNKLISRFEPQSITSIDRPRIMPIRTRQYSEEYSDDETDNADDTDDQDDDCFEENETLTRPAITSVSVKVERDTSTTPTNSPKSKVQTEQLKSSNLATATATTITSTERNEKHTTIAEITILDSENNEKHYERPNELPLPRKEQKSPIDIPKISLSLDRNSNYSRPSSEYGSPLEYPSSLIGSTETTPVPDRKDQELLSASRRSRRSMTRDDERFFSFDSDEENSYYSISSTGSSRYVVEI